MTKVPSSCFLLFICRFLIHAELPGFCCFLVAMGIEPRALHTLGKCSELYLQIGSP